MDIAVDRQESRASEVLSQRKADPPPRLSESQVEQQRHNELSHSVIESGNQTMSAEFITQESKDRELARRVRMAIIDRFFPALHNLDVEVVRGVATLRGRVPTTYERRLARYRARGVQGVTGVVDAIEVESLPSHSDPHLLRNLAANGLPLAVAALLAMFSIETLSATAIFGEPAANREATSDAIIPRVKELTRPLSKEAHTHHTLGRMLHVG